MIKKIIDEVNGIFPKCIQCGEYLNKVEVDLMKCCGVGSDAHKDYHCCKCGLHMMQFKQSSDEEFENRLKCNGLHDKIVDILSKDMNLSMLEVKEKIESMVGFEVFESNIDMVYKWAKPHILECRELGIM